MGMDYGASVGSANSIGGYISLGITVFFAVCIFLGVLYGFKRGFFKTLIRIITLAASAIASFLIVINTYTALDTEFTKVSMSDIVAAISANATEPLDPGTITIIESFDVETVAHLLMLIACLVVAPIAFVVIFYLLKLVSLIIYAILSAILGFGGRYKSFLNRLGGAVAGAVQGALIAIVALLPVIGFLGLAEDSRDHLIESASDEAAVTVSEFYVNYVDEATDNVIYTTARGLGADQLFGMLTSAKIDEEPVDMRESAKCLATVFVDCISVGELRWSDLSEGNKNALVEILADIGDDEYTASVVAGILRGMSTAVENGAMQVQLDDPYDDLVASLLTVFLNTDADSLKDDLGTILDVYFILNDSRVLAQFDPEVEVSEDVKDLLIAKDESGNTVIQNIINELNSNPHTAPIVTEFTKFSLKLMADSVGNALPPDVDTEKLYEDVKTGISGALDAVNDETLSTEEKKESVKNTINDTLVESGVMTEDNKIDDDIMDSITDYVVENYQGKTELSDEDINNAILHYYEAYANSGTIPTLPDGSQLPDLDDIPDQNEG